MTYNISEERFKKQRRSDATGEAKKVQINAYVRPVRKLAIDAYIKAITAELRPLRGLEFTVSLSDLIDDYLNRDPHFGAIERKLKREYESDKREEWGIDIGK